MRKRSLWLLPVLLFLWAGVSAQSTKWRKANQYFAEGDYRAAIPLYEEVLGQEDLAEAKIRLAEAFRFLGNYQSSAQWYALVVSLPESKPEHKYYYGLMLLYTGDCEAAGRWFRDYLKYQPYDPRKPRLLNACDYTRSLAGKNAGKVKVSLPDFNSPNSELGPAYYKNGLVFSAFRKSEEDPSRSFLDLFMVDANGGGMAKTYSPPVLFSGSIQSKFHEGIVTFNSEETEIFFTRTRDLSSRNLFPNIRRMEIVSARLLPQGGWSNLQPLHFSSDNYSVGHPSLSKDGKRLFFSSDMPGGKGGKDLYLSFFENGQWGPPINLGPAVNTPDDEVFPYISDSGKLYFSSTGHLGMGGQDIFWTEEGADGLWVVPENMGYPINTEADDFGIILNKTESEGYFTSRRSGGKGKDDIYFFQMAAPSGTVTQVDVIDIGSSAPIPNARVLNSCSGEMLQAGPDGRLVLLLPECCTLSGQAAGYQKRSVEACGRAGDLPEDTLFIALALAPEPQPEPVLQQKEIVEVETTSPFVLSGLVLSRENGKPVFQAEVRLTSSKCPAPSAILTDKQGRFSLALEANCCYELRLERDNFFTQTIGTPICANGDKPEQFFKLYMTPYLADPGSEGDGGGIPVKMDTEDKGIGFYSSREAGTDNFAFRINVYYDVGRSSVQKGSVDELTRLLQLMQDNPAIILEISSHTDSQGDDLSNQALSQKRADAIVRFLISQGVSKERLVAKGYGESRLANHCVDGVSCTEEEHQQNRRTEFKVLGKVQ